MMVPKKPLFGKVGESPPSCQVAEYFGLFYCYDPLAKGPKDDPSQAEVGPGPHWCPEENRENGNTAEQQPKGYQYLTNSQPPPTKGEPEEVRNGRPGPWAFTEEAGIH